METVPLEIVDATARWAGLYLYDGRLIADTMGDKTIQKHKKMFEYTIRGILAGTVHLDLPRDDVTYPIVVKDTRIYVTPVI